MTADPNPKQRDLRFGGQVTDLVEKQRIAVCGFKTTGQARRA
jgi:hypothetical protein